MFGLLIYNLFSGESLFPTDVDENLSDSSAFGQLVNWDKKAAEKVIYARIDDPLAQDLLMHILVPQEDRWHSMNLVMSHPFFGPASSIEAQYILEKHEELQLMMEETVTIQRANMTMDTLRKMDNSTEKQCKILFEEDVIVVPTCLIVLPYELKWNSSMNNLLASPSVESPNNAELASSIGKCLLDINKVTVKARKKIPSVREAVLSITITTVDTVVSVTMII